jgi:hypothetical protein
MKSDGGRAGGGFAYVLFECRKVCVEGDAAEVVDEGEVLGDVCRGPAAEEPVQNPLVSPWRGTATNGSTPPLERHITRHSHFV